MIRQSKKLIEVALPLEAINNASAREKSIRHGHPSTLHLWWARRPLAAARAVIFAQMVDDPSEYIDELRNDPGRRSDAELALKKQQILWSGRRDAYERELQKGTVVPEPGKEPTLESVLEDLERERLFEIIEELVKWENTTDETVLSQARDELWKSWQRTCAQNAEHPQARQLFDRHILPAFHDPFAGGGALPLEAQRLGLESHASDLNPVAVLINKAMIEIPPRFSGKPPINPDWRNKPAEARAAHVWQGAQGLAEDVRYYGQWMREEAEKRIGHLYPQIEVTEEMARERPDLKQYVGQKLTVIAWLWARTVKSPNPAFADVDVPLASTFMLSTKDGKEAYIECLMECDESLHSRQETRPQRGYRFTVKTGKPQNLEEVKKGTSAGRRKAFRCLISDAPITYDYIRAEGQAGRMGARMMAIVAEGRGGRVYLSPTSEMEAIAKTAEPEWKPETPLHGKCRVNVANYGLDTFGDLFTPRQLVALTTFSDLVTEARAQVLADALAAGMPGETNHPTKSTFGAADYADAVMVYLSLIVDKCADYWSVICSWHSSKELIRNTFGRQAIPMVWDYVESNIFCSSSGNYTAMLDWAWKAIECVPITVSGIADQEDAQSQTRSINKIVSTDPPYYDNIGYADLSDFFYVWLRRSLQPVYPGLFSTMAVPKAEELVATPYRHGGKAQAEEFFLNGMTEAMQQLAEQAHPAFPVTIYYAFKQAESSAKDGTASTGWETFLDAVMRAGFSITGTWPMRTEMSNRMIGSGTNALASSIVLVCRRRAANAPAASRREFLNALRAELPPALLHLQHSNIAPVDLAQAAIGPGMAVYTRYSKVLDAEGRALSVRQALALINEMLDETLAEQEGDFDADSRWALAWFDQYGFTPGEYGVAETLSKAKNTSVRGVVEAGIAEASHGQVRLLRPSELPTDWTPQSDRRLTVWDMVHHLIRVLEKGGEEAAAAILAELGAKATPARELCYRLYTLCERRKRATEALSYNSLVQSWPEIAQLTQTHRVAGLELTLDL